MSQRQAESQSSLSVSRAYEEQLGDSHLSGSKPFRIMLYLAMYITGHVHTTHLSTAVSGTHPKLDEKGDELFSCA